MNTPFTTRLITKNEKHVQILSKQLQTLKKKKKKKKNKQTNIDQ